MTCLSTPRRPGRSRSSLMWRKAVLCCCCNRLCGWGWAAMLASFFGSCLHGRWYLMWQSHKQNEPLWHDLLYVVSTEQWGTKRAGCAKPNAAAEGCTSMSPTFL